ncbi:hypothetical protein FB192DRAFT_1379804 [Mucor lusitanicus]|uniref:DUF7082 domain-containing protein n=1 Tax=Mucor circinelloides f. lusitanicus TaxID=29924 RepID=A0A8H4BI72_MUCCL|nr:hypothetical protein FB192DRAFT_1379804 [Mucor lusitanicus]
MPLDYDMLLKDVDDGSTGAHKEANELFQGLFAQAHDHNSISNLSSSASSSPQQHADVQRRPNVVQWGPHDGQESGTIVSIVLQHHQEAAPMKIVFGALTVETAQQQHTVDSSSSNDSSVWITLAASVPPLKDVRSDAHQVRISVCLFDRNDPDLAVDTWDVGHFTYLEEDQAITSSRKRALSCEPDECAQKKHTYDVKADHEQQHSEDVNSQLLKLLAPYDPLLTASHSDSNGSASAATATNAWLSPTSSSDSSCSSSRAPQHPSNYSTSSVPPTFPLTVNHMMLQQGLLNSKRPQQQQYLASSSSSSLDMAHKQQDMYRMYSNMQQQRHHPYLMHQHYPNQPTNYMSHAMSNYIQSMGSSHHNSILYSMPDYQRIQQQSLSTPYTTSSSSQSVPRRASAPSTTSYTTTSSNSCALNKAHLKLNGDLMDMVTNWSVPEWQSGRRLVHFWRRTTTGADGNLALVECGFEPMDQQLYHQQRMRDNVAAVAAAAAAAAAVSNNGASVNIKSHASATTGSRHAGGGGGGANNTAPIVISCIYWRERNDYFITSVDCIYLLESLIGIQFTVEEKNRIRRNLEGFRPLTVSKCKAECADFFKLIMSFPHPKPRNIEKDVKVFSWKTLPHALRKIIRKYTPSYIASTPLEPIHPQQTSNSASSSSASHLHHSNINKF